MRLSPWTGWRNVIGKIPDLEELTEEARALVEFQGIRVDESDTEKGDAARKEVPAEGGPT